jgi:acyl transferase domain-containing protein/acyl carrier protein
MTDSQAFLERINRLSPKRVALLALDLQTRLDAADANRDETIAIIGMGCRFPGGVVDPSSYWRLLCDGLDAIREIPADRWDVDALYDPDPEAPGKIATRWGGFVDGIDRFDPHAFGISPREAASMDPQQRLLLEVGWEALEHAGYAPDGVAESPTGVFVGICNGDYYQMLMDCDPATVDAYAATGSAHSVASGRLSYLLGLRGPSLSVDTACSSSLVSVHLAVQSLHAGECRMALAGGVNAILNPRTSIALSRAKMMAADGRCKAFDASADGFVRSEGCGLVVLKRLSDAEADGDRILALIRGSAVNQDGRSNGLTAPNGPSQVAVIRQALVDASLEPSQIGYVETHGTGTSLGDPIEIQALSAALGGNRADADRLMLGSVKTNIGHLESASGIAGLIKTVLMLQHQQIPPHLHLHTPNPHIAWDEMALSIPTQLTDWQPSSGRRLAGVSSFGFSGTNAHVILEQPPLATPTARPEGPQRPRHLLALSAKNDAALRELAGRYAEVLAAAPSLSLAEVAHTANTGRARFGHRLTVVGTDAADVAPNLARLAAGEDPADMAHTAMGQPHGRPRLAFLFTGHGSLYRGAGRRLWETQPIFRAALERCAGFADQHLEKPLLAALYPHLYPDVDGAQALLDDMTYAQPALFALQYALASLWQTWGVVPSFVAGHSAGEYAAACIAGILSVQDGLTLTMARGRLMRSLPPNGQMATVLADEATVRAALAPHGDARVAIGAINGPASIAISGDLASVQSVVAELQATGIETRALNIPLAAHSPQVEPILDEFERVARGVSYAPPGVSVVSTLTGALASGSDCASATYWRRHLREPVQFAQAMQTLHRQGCDVFLEIGPRATLLGMARANLPESGAAATWLPSLRADHDDWEQILDSLGGLFVAGVDVDFAAFDRDGGDWPRLALPTYPFQRERYWIAPSRPAAMSMDAGGHPLLGQRLDSPALDPTQTIFAAQLSADWPPFLDHHRVHGVCIVPSPVYVAMALEAARRGPGWDEAILEDLSIQSALVIPETGTRAVQFILDMHADGAASFRIFSRNSAPEEATWTLHAAGRLTRSQAAPPATDRFDANAVRARCSEMLDGAGYYDRLLDLGLEFGPDFRGISRLWRSDGEALAEITLPAGLEREAGVYRIHPAFLDACFHVLGALVPQSTPESQAYLLIGIDRLELGRAPGSRLWSHARIRSGSMAGSETFVGDIHVHDDAGDLVGEITGLQLKRAGADALRRAARRSPSDWLYETTWQEKVLPAPAEPDGVNSLSTRWLILADDRGIAAELAELISARGDRCELVGNSAEFANRAPSAQRLVDLGSLKALPSESVPDRAGRVADTALHVVQALATSRSSAQVWLVTRDAQSVSASNTLTEPALATLWGLGRVIALEHPQNWGGLVDLASDLAPRTAAALLYDDITRSDGEDQVALGDGRRYVPRLERASSQRPRSTVFDFCADASYLVTGGLGGLGLKVAHWMAEHGARHLVLTGRSGLPDRSLWDGLEPTSRTASQVASVRAIEALGATVSPIAVDVADEALMRTRVMARFGDDLPPLRGVVHAAADLSGWSVADMPSEALQAMLRPKIGGAWVLHELTRDVPLDFLVLFSSTSALWGAQTLGHYAAANSFLDAFAHYRHALGLPCVSINWGTWDEMRLTTAEDRESYQQFGLSPMSSPQALAILGEILGTSEMTQIAVAAVDWRSLKPLYEARRARPFLADVDALPTGSTRAASQRVQQRPPLLALLESAADSAERHTIIFDHVRAEVARTLHVVRPQGIDPHTGLFDLGMDSLMSVELKSKLEVSVGRPLPSTLTFNYSTVSALATYLADEVLMPPAPEPSAPPPPARPAAAELQLDDIDDLSEDELEATLAAKLARLR